VTLAFADLGFEHLYTVEVNPEYPSGGNWPIPAVQFGEKGRDRLTIKVSSSDGDPWVGSFALETRGVVTGVFACPNPEQFLVATGLEAYVLDARDPDHAEALPVHPVTVVRRPAGTDLLLVGSFTGVAALNRSGVRWVVDQLFLDDLEVLDGPPGSIRVQGREHAQAKPSAVVLDTDDGRVLSRERT
jgi:hypothetical protein